MSYMNDEDYTFRGQPISGPAAYCLLGAIKRVLAEAPNPTLEDILALDKIVKDFEEKFAHDLQRAYENGEL